MTYPSRQAESLAMVLLLLLGARTCCANGTTGLCLYRIAQESLRNVIKHSGAPEARIRLTGEGGEIHMEVEDQGAGFDPQAARARAGLGFVSMRERLRLVGGELSVRSQPEFGTTVLVRVPRQPSVQIEEQTPSAFV